MVAPLDHSFLTTVADYKATHGELQEDLCNLYLLPKNWRSKSYLVTSDCLWRAGISKEWSPGPELGASFRMCESFHRCLLLSVDFGGVQELAWTESSACAPFLASAFRIHKPHSPCHLIPGWLAVHNSCLPPLQFSSRAVLSLWALHPQPSQGKWSILQALQLHIERSRDYQSPTKD